MKTAAKPGALLSSRQIAEMRSVHRNTVFGWLNVGIRVGGKVVKLIGHKSGTVWRVHPEALAEFLAACNPGMDVARIRTPSQERKARERDRELFRAANRRKG